MYTYAAMLPSLYYVHTGTKPPFPAPFGEATGLVPSSHNPNGIILYYYIPPMGFLYSPDAWSAPLEGRRGWYHARWDCYFWGHHIAPTGLSYTAPIGLLYVTSPGFIAGEGRRGRSRRGDGAVPGGATGPVPEGRRGQSWAVRTAQAHTARAAAPAQARAHSGRRALERGGGGSQMRRGRSRCPGESSPAGSPAGAGVCVRGARRRGPGLVPRPRPRLKAHEASPRVMAGQGRSLGPAAGPCRGVRGPARGRSRGQLSGCRRRPVPTKRGVRRQVAERWLPPQVVMAPSALDVALLGAHGARPRSGMLPSSGELPLPSASVGGRRRRRSSPPATRLGQGRGCRGCAPCAAAAGRST